MADWRRQKYVADSEDEGDALSSSNAESQQEHDPTQNRFPDIDAIDERIIATATSTELLRTATKFTQQNGFQRDGKGNESTQIQLRLEERCPSEEAQVEQPPVIATGNPENDDGFTDIDELQLGQPTTSSLRRRGTVQRSLKTFRSRYNKDFLDEKDVDELQQDQDIQSSPALPAIQFATELLQKTPTSVHAQNSSSTLKTRTALPNSILSSPLTDPSRSPSISPTADSVDGKLHSISANLPLARAEIKKATFKDPQSLPQRLISGSDAAESRPPTRVFRQRNAIQLHPYVLEGERYRQILQARGVKPIKINQEKPDNNDASSDRSQDNDVAADDDSQFINNDDVTQDIASTSPPRAPSSHSSPLRTQAAELDKDEFPDVETLLRQPISGVSYQGFKRKKTAHIFPKKHGFQAAPSRTTPLRSLDGPPVLDSLPRAKLSRSLENRPSPPLSTSPAPASPSIVIIDGFHYPAGVAPVQLQTPVPSSEGRGPQRIELASSSEVDEEADSGLETRQTSGNQITVDSSSSESDRAYQIRRVQRKIKGVLPASWLRLDLKTQPPKFKPGSTTVRATNVSPIRKDNQRGVARPLSRRGEGPGELAPAEGPFEISDDATSDEDDTTASEIQTSANIKLNDGLDDTSTIITESLDFMEDNDIDRMLPPRFRASNNASVLGPRKVRTRRTDIRTGLFQIQPLRVTRQPKMLDHVIRERNTQQQAPKFRLPSLSILDTIPLEEIQAAPRFVRVAARIARLRADEGQQTPHRKFFCLATKDDTADVEETLRPWREGTLAPPLTPSTNYQPNRTSTRRPLTARSANEQTPPALTYPRAEREAYKSTLHRSTKRPEGRKVRKVQTTLEEALRRQSSRRPREQRSLERTLPTAAQKRGRARKPRISSSLRTSASYKPAVLESLEGSAGLVSSDRGLRLGHNNVLNSDRQPQVQNLMLERFLDSPEPRSTSPPTSKSIDKAQGPYKHSLTETISRPQPQPRKRPPQHINISVSQYRQSSPPSLSQIHPNNEKETPKEHTTTKSLLKCLGSFGTDYPVDFGVEPLPLGLHFHRETFIGSGAFNKSLTTILTRDLDQPRPSVVMKNNGKSFQWGPWNDNVSTELSLAFSRLSEALEQVRRKDGIASCSDNEMKDAIFIQESLIQYLSDNLFFLDPIDRRSFARKCTDLLLMLLGDLDDTISSPRSTLTASSAPNSSSQMFCTRLSARCVVLLNQLRHIAAHDLITSSLRQEIQSLLDAATRRTSSLISHDKFDQIRSLLRDCKSMFIPQCGLRADQYIVETIVILFHTSKQDNSSIGSFWSVLNASSKPSNTTRSLSASDLDRRWNELFHVLPLLGFDPKGKVSSKQWSKDTPDDWETVTSLVKPVLQSYLQNPKGQGVTFNSYCRTILARCLYLIKAWGWRKCESIIGTLFDFFAKNNLANLHNEESSGSPVFLENLADKPNLAYRKEDRCFHILLKILGTGLRGMQSIYSDKKISGIVFRLMPNHSRTHPKDEAIRREDLDALRNHHDLLCTLYWASPAGSRPRISVIQNLVHLEDSHREVCHINIRSWSNLVRFQLSTDEPIKSLEPFADWYSDLVEQILRQHKLARTEVEIEVNRAECVGGCIVTRELQDSTIARNQRHVEAILADALVSLRKAIEAARSVEHATKLMPKILTGVFGLFDAKHPRINMVVIEALEVVLAYNKRCRSSSSNIDSQGFDGSSVFDEDFGFDDMKKNDSHTDDPIYNSIRRLLSNCFGADVVPEDPILTKLVETWSSIAQLAVKGGTRTWESYLGPYGPDSWTSLGDTEQTRKFTPFFLAKIIEVENGMYEECKDHLFRTWVSSLVERESLLKFQHQLTAMIINSDYDNPLLVNLPFSANSTTGQFSVSASDFRNRRLSLISSILANMRESLDFSTYHNLSDRVSQKQEYVDILQTLMCSMKHNYQELGHGSWVRGAYVDFVQKVVESLQQYSAEILPVDRYFTDSAAFPLPATDPTYVVGRLRNYGLRLQDSRIPKQLAAFIQTVSERAAVDGQQQYLVEQLYTAMSNTFEHGDSSKPTLRSFLVQAIFPVYIELAISTSCAWLLAVPILQALQKLMGNIRQDLDGANERSIDAVEETIMTLLGSFQMSLTMLANEVSLVQQPRILRTLASYFAVTTAALPTFDYITRLRDDQQPAFRAVTAMKVLSGFVASLVNGEPEVQGPDILPEPEVVDTRIQTIRSFTATELMETLGKQWSEHDGRFYLVRGNTRREVRIDIGTLEEERASFLAQVDRFFDVVAGLPAFDDGQGAMSRRQERIGLENLIF